MNIKNVLFGLALIVTLTTLFLYKHSFSYSYSENREQLSDLFNFSQWRIPQSTRVISDEKLYQVAADYIIRGNNLYDINPEVPPLGKYLYGLGIIFFDNPYITAILLYLATIGIFALLARQAKLTSEQVGFATLVLVTTPLFFSQLGQTMLDLPQLFFVLLHCYFLLPVLLSKKALTTNKYLVAAGIFLGLAAAVKFPVFVLVVAGFDGVLLLLQKKWREGMFFAASTVVGYILPYLYYLSSHPVREFLGAQKWMVHFYRGQYSEVSPLGNVWHFFSGQFRDYAGTMQRSEEWTVVLPVVAVAVLIYLLNKLRGFKLTNLIARPLDYYALLFIVLLFPLFFLSLYTRYFVLLLPLGLLCLGHYYYKSARMFLLVPILLISLYQSAVYIRPQPMATLKFAVIDWKNGNYQDFYSHLTENSPDMIRAEYLSRLKTIEFATQSQLQNITFDIPKTTFLTSAVDGTVTIEYKTHAGSYKHSSPAHFKREDGNWKLAWEWQLLASEMNKDDTLTLVEREKNPGTITSLDGVPLAYTSNQPFIYILPDKIGERAPFIDALSALSGWSTVALENHIFVKARTLTEIPLSVPLPTQKPEPLPEVLAESIVLKERPVRKYDPRLKAEKLEEVKLFEDQNRDALGLAPLLVLEKSTGEEQLLLGNPQQEIKDIILPKNSQELL